MTSAPGPGDLRRACGLRLRPRHTSEPPRCAAAARVSSGLAAARERMGGRRTGARERMRGRRTTHRGARRWRNPAGRARCLKGHRTGESHRLVGLLVGEHKHVASPAAERRRLVGERRRLAGCLVGAGRARGKEARGELAGWRRGASSLGKLGAGGGDEVRRAHVRDSSPGGWDRRDKERKKKRRKF